MGGDDEDIMFVEDKDPLTEDEPEQFIHEETVEEQMQFVASEMVVEETVDTSDDGVTHNDASNDLPIVYSITSTNSDNPNDQSIENVDVEEHVPAVKLNNSKEAINEQSETISLSDSLSCFDSESDPQEVTEMEEMEFNSKNKNKSNESNDDVILMADCMDNNDDSSSIPNENDNNQRSNLSAAIENNENLTDYDDDSSTSQDRRAIRSRGDRKNNSYCRNYVSRHAVETKLDNELDESNTQSEAGNSPSQNTVKMSESQQPQLIANQQHQYDQLNKHKENADYETQVEFKFKQNASIRTYQRQKKTSSFKPLFDDHQRDDSTLTDVIKSETVERSELNRLELVETAVDTDEINIKLNTEIGSISESDSNSQIEVEVLRKKRPVGRPRKQRANAISDRSESEQENQEQMSQSSRSEINLLVETPSEIVEQTGLEIFSSPPEPNDSLPMDTSASTSSNVLFDESFVKSEIKDETEVSNTQVSTNQSVGENIFEPMPVKSESVKDLSFEFMEVNGEYFEEFY